MLLGGPPVDRQRVQPVEDRQQPAVAVLLDPDLAPLRDAQVAPGQRRQAGQHGRQAAGEVGDVRPPRHDGDTGSACGRPGLGAHRVGPDGDAHRAEPAQVVDDGPDDAGVEARPDQAPGAPPVRVRLDHPPAPASPRRRTSGRTNRDRRSVGPRGVGVAPRGTDGLQPFRCVLRQRVRIGVHHGPPVRRRRPPAPLHRRPHAQSLGLRERFRASRHAEFRSTPCGTRPFRSISCAAGVTRDGRAGRSSSPPSSPPPPAAGPPCRTRCPSASVGHQVRPPQRRPVDVHVSASISRIARTAPATSPVKIPAHEPVGGAVRLGDRRLPVGRRAHRDGGPEQLLLVSGDAGRRRDDRRRDHRARRGAAGQHAALRRGRVVDRCLAPAPPRCSLIRAPTRLSWRRGSPIRIALTWHEGVEEVAAHGRMGDHALHRNAHLARVRVAPAATAAAATSRSVSGRITTGHDAPSSSDSFLTPAVRVIRSPTALDPVNRPRTRGSATSASPDHTARPGHHREHAVGSPASTKTRPAPARERASAARGLEDHRVAGGQRGRDLVQDQQPTGS